MSQESVERIRRGFDSLNHGDVDAMLALTHPEITATAAPGWPEPGPFVGRDAAVAEIKRLTDWGENRFTNIDVVADEGEWVVITFHWDACGAASGIQTQFDLAAAVRVKDALIIEWHNRWSRDEALEAAGLSE